MAPKLRHTAQSVSPLFYALNTIQSGNNLSYILRNLALVFSEEFGIMGTSIWHSPLPGSLAQSVEQWTFNPLVIGSNPIRPTYSQLFATKDNKRDASLKTHWPIIP